MPSCKAFVYFSLIFLPPCCCCCFQREQWKQQRRRQQTEPAVPAGRWKVSHVQLGGRVFSTSESRPELSAFASGQHEPPGRLRLPYVRPGGATAGAQHARTPAPTAGLLVGTSNLQSCGFGLLKRLPDYSILQKQNPDKKKRRLISVSDWVHVWNNTIVAYLII